MVIVVCLKKPSLIYFSEKNNEKIDMNSACHYCVDCRNSHSVMSLAQNRGAGRPAPDFDHPCAPEQPLGHPALF